MLSINDVKSWVANMGAPVEFHAVSEDTPTVPDAARALGVKVEQIIKSLVFLVDGQPYLTISNGETKIDDRKLGNLLGVSRNKVKFAPGDKALEITGFRGGVMPPFAHKVKLPVIIDQGVLKQTKVYGGTGDPMVLLAIEPQALKELTHAQVADIAAGQ